MISYAWISYELLCVGIFFNFTVLIYTCSARAARIFALNLLVSIASGMVLLFISSCVLGFIYAFLFEHFELRITVLLLGIHCGRYYCCVILCHTDYVCLSTIA